MTSKTKMVASFCTGIFLLFTILAPNFIFGQIADYVPLEPLPGTLIDGSNKTNLQTYLPGILRLATGVAIVLAIIMIAIGGMQYIGTESIGGKGAGKKKIQDAILGLLLLFGAYLILFTINPGFVSTTLTINIAGPGSPTQLLTEEDIALCTDGKDNDADGGTDQNDNGCVAVLAPCVLNKSVSCNTTNGACAVVNAQTLAQCTTRTTGVGGDTPSFTNAVLSDKQALSFSYTLGATELPPTQKLQITSYGFIATKSETWFNINPTSENPSENVVGREVTVEVNPLGLNEGTYTGEIVFADNDTDPMDMPSVTIPVTLTVYPKPVAPPPPDPDGDQVTGTNDKCPDQAGPASNNGCPILDKDGDGVNDSVDECPDVFGSASKNGCPWTPPTVTAGPDQTVLYPNTGSFTFNGTWSGGEPGKTYSYLWTQVTGTTQNVLSSVSKTGTSLTVNSQYLMPGTYTFRFNLLDTAGKTVASSQGSSDAVLEIQTDNQVPAAQIVPICSDYTCTLDGSKSTDDIGIASYTWDFGDGTSGSGIKTTHTYKTAGLYSVKLTVTDVLGKTASIAGTLNLPQATPKATISENCLYLVCEFDGTKSTGSIKNYVWIITDSNGDNVLIGPRVTYTFKSSGTYKVVLMASNDVGGLSTVSKDITVSNAPAPSPSPFIDLKLDGSDGPVTKTVGSTGTFTWTSSLTYSCSGNFGDIGGSVGGSKSYTFNSPGTTTFTLSCTTNSQGTASTANEVNVIVQ